MNAGDLENSILVQHTARGAISKGVENMFLVKCSSCHWPGIRKSGKGGLGELDGRDLALRGRSRRTASGSCNLKDGAERQHDDLPSWGLTIVNSAAR